MKLVFKFGKYFQNMDVLITYLSGTAFDKISFCNFRFSFSVPTFWSAPFRCPYMLLFSSYNVCHNSSFIPFLSLECSGFELRATELQGQAHGDPTSMG